MQQVKLLVGFAQGVERHVLSGTAVEKKHDLHRSTSAFSTFLAIHVLNVSEKKHHLQLQIPSCRFLTSVWTGLVISMFAQTWQHI